MIDGKENRLMLKMDSEHPTGKKKKFCGEERHFIVVKWQLKEESQRTLDPPDTFIWEKISPKINIYYIHCFQPSFKFPTIPEFIDTAPHSF